MKIKIKKRLFALVLSLIIIMQILPVNATVLSDSNLADGSSSLFPFYSIDIGRAGIIKVNQQNRELIIEREDISLPGSYIPVDITFYYSSYNKGSNKWHLKYNISLKRIDDETISMVRNDGSVATYKSTGQFVGDKEKWIVPEEFGAFDYLLINPNSTNFSDATLVSNFNGTYYFDSIGRIVTVENSNGYGLTRINYNNSGKISDIIDDIGRVYSFLYDENNLLVEVKILNSNREVITVSSNEKNSIPYVIKYKYNNKKLLESVTYPDGNVVEYSYKNDKLHKIKNVDQKTIIITYNGIYTKSISQVSQKEKTKILFEITKVNDEIFVSNEYQKNIKNDFNGLTPKKVKEAGNNYLNNLRQKNAHTQKILSNNPKGTTSTNSVLSQDKTINKIEPNYNFDSDTGLVEYVYDNYGHKTFIDYDNSLNIVKMSAMVSSLTEEIANEYYYENDILKSISRNDFNYDFLYDEWGNNSGMEIQGRPFISYTYKDGKSEMCEKVVFGNGQTINYYYDSENRITGISIDSGESLLYEYYYNDSGVRIVDNLSGITQNYFSDSVNIMDNKTGQILMSLMLQDNTQITTVNDISFSLNVNVCDVENKTDYAVEYDYAFADINATIHVIKDCFDRITHNSVKYSTGEIKGSDILYTEIDGNTTLLPRSISTNYSFGNNEYSSDWSYEYNKNGNVSKVVLNGQPYTCYEYDEIDQLKKVDDYVLQRTTIYEYDKGGNIVNKTLFELNNPNKIIDVIEYSYEDAHWKDKLTGYDELDIVYDNIGNPVSYSNCTFNWNLGRVLENYQNEEYRVEYRYNDIGYRQEKNVYSRETDALLYQYRYFWNGNFLSAYTLTDYTKENIQTDTIVYQYDDDMNIYSFVVNNKEIYIYDKNAAGDIIGIYNKGQLIAKYHYDEYGKIHTLKLSSEAKKYNHLYYRGYMYDSESNLYYLQSRYYSPEWGRFINADIFADTGTGLLGTNMFIYCDNDPINKIDPWGFWGVSLHRQLTHEILGEVDLETHFDAYEIADGNAYTDTLYSAVLYAASPTKQGRHFDRHISVSEADGEDTRIYYSTQHMNNAVQAYRSNDYEKANQELGFALHCLQDISSHGNIDVNRSSFASHAGITGVDSPDYDWTNDSDRGLTDKNNCVRRINTDYGDRYAEAQELTAWGYVVFSALLNQ